MGGLPCAKVIIDQSVAFKSQLDKQLAGLDKALGCMSNTIYLSTTSYVYPTDEQEDNFVRSCDDALAGVRSALERVSALASEIEREVRERAEKPQMDVPPDNINKRK